jgi:hypothetical protein
MYMVTFGHRVNMLGSLSTPMPTEPLLRMQALRSNSPLLKA